MGEDTDGFIWKEIGSRYGVDEDATIPSEEELHAPTSPARSDSSIRRKLSKLFSNISKRSQQTASVPDQDKESNPWRRRVRHAMCFFFAPESRPSDSDLVLSNNKKTVTCKRTSKWDTIRMNIALLEGYVYTWEYTLTHHDNSSYNIYRIFVGIERSTYDFDVVGFDKIIGYNSHGVSYNVGQHTVHREFTHGTDKSPLQKDIANFETGDKITVVLDLKETCTMQMYKNGEWFVTFLDIPTGSWT